MNEDIRYYKALMNGVKFTSNEKNRLMDNLLRASAEADSAKRKSHISHISEGNKMSKWNIKKTIAAAAIALIASGGAVYAAGQITTLSSGSSPLDYKYSYDDVDKINSKAGVDADMPESFSNGFTFDKAAVITVNGSDFEGNVVESWPEIDINYKGADGGLLYISIEDAVHTESSMRYDTATELREIDGVLVAYNLDEYVFLPPSYEETGLTDEMQNRLDNDPHFYVSYGSSEEQHEFFSNTTFIKDGVYYNIYRMDAELSADDYFQMAEEIITR